MMQRRICRSVAGRRPIVLADVYPVPMMNLVRPGAISATVCAAPASTDGIRPKGLVTAGNSRRRLVAPAASPMVTKVSRQIIWLSKMPAPSKPASSIFLMSASSSGMGDVPGTRIEILMESAMGSASVHPRSRGSLHGSISARNALSLYRVRRSRGSSVSLSQSPNRFSAITTMVMARPGISESHHRSSRLLRPSETMMPQAGSPGGTPTPRKLSEASSSIVCPTSRLMMTNTVLTTLGKMCRHIITWLGTPATTASVTKSRSLMLSTSPRTCRANRAHTVAMMAMTTF